METGSEPLEFRLKDSALVVLRRYHIGEDELQIEANEPGKPAFFLIRGHRVRVHVDERSAAFSVRTGRWSGARVDYPTAGAFIAAFEEALQEALSD